MDQNTSRYILIAAGIAAAIILVELIKSRAISSFWKITGAASK